MTGAIGEGLSPAERVHLAAALGDHIRRCRREGIAVPAGLARLREELLERDASRNAQARRRALSAARSRRYRQRRKAARAAGSGAVTGGRVA